MSEQQHSGSGDINSSLALMWEYDEKAARGPKPKLSLGAIVERAIAIADAEGLDAVSMRRVAKELEVGTMSLYRYVPGKAELLDLMLEEVGGLSDDVEPARDWREAAEQMGRGLWRLYTTHRWLPFVDQSRPILGPKALKAFDFALAGLQDTGLSAQELVSVISMLDAFAQSAARSHNNAATAEERTGISSEEFWKAQEPVLVQAMTSGDYPHVAALAEDAFEVGGEAFFEFGLQRMLDGLEVLVAARASGGR
jgi:AcrR family transcriptional regulator